MDFNLNEIVTQLLSVTEVATSKVFQLAVQQVAVDAIINGVIALVALVLAVGAVKTAVPLIKEYWQMSHSSSNEDALAILYHIWLIASVLVFFVSSITALSYAANPEWFAIRMLLDTFVK